jgi:hypothetical protein
MCCGSQLLRAFLPDAGALHRGEIMANRDEAHCRYIDIRVGSVFRSSALMRSPGWMVVRENKTLALYCIDVRETAPRRL